MALILLLLVLTLVAGAVLVGARLLQPAPADLGIFDPVAGRIVHGDGRGIWGVDPAAPADPATRVRLASDPGIPLGWSGDGTRLLITRRQPVRPSRRRFRGLVTEGPWRITGATISPDGSRVVFAGVTKGTGSALYAVDADGGPAERLLEAGDGWSRNRPFRPTGHGSRMHRRGGSQQQRVADGRRRQRCAPDTGERDVAGHVRGLAWSPAGDRLAFGLGGAIYSFAADGSDLTRCGGPPPRRASAAVLVARRIAARNARAPGIPASRPPTYRARRRAADDRTLARDGRTAAGQLVLYLDCV